MASVYNYSFDNLSRLGDDKCNLSERNMQNNNFCNHTTTNYFPCGMKKPLQVALQQPNVFLNGGFGNSGAGGCNIDSDSDLKIGTIQTNPKCRISLFARPFTTVPYLGRGAVRPVVEARLQQGEFVHERKSCNTITDKTFTQQYTPLVPSLKSNITNPHNLVEGVADKNWIRGGLPSREYVRDQDYYQRGSC
uniref:Uncharacterized protein n=1 Tax=viral metagenome TaxID=1070528 RepID=A0A6C0KGI7_9ZZZZ